MEFLRRQLSDSAALSQLSVLAVVVGLVTGVVVLLFRGAIEGVTWLLHGGTSDGYEALGLEWRVLLPILGALGLGLLLNRLPPDSRRFRCRSRHGTPGAPSWSATPE